MALSIVYVTRVSGQYKNGRRHTSQQFKRWFGNWEKRTSTFSKVVNGDGTPKIVYHGTNAEFWTFDPRLGAYFFSESRNDAEAMAKKKSGERVVDAYLDMKRPYEVTLPVDILGDPTVESPYILYA